jgi:hypothetical protein
LEAVYHQLDFLFRVLILAYLRELQALNRKKSDLISLPNWSIVVLNFIVEIALSVADE